MPPWATGRASVVAASPATTSKVGRAACARKKDIGPKLAAPRRLLLWQLAAVAWLALTADLLAQLFEGARFSEYDYLRTARFTFFRAVVATPVYIYWLSHLDAIADRLAGLTGLWPLVIKLLLDQGLYGPTYQVVFFCFLAALEGQPLNEGLRRCMLIVPHSIPVAWCFWLPTMAICFTLVPLPWRVIYVNALSIIWNTVMSLYNSAAAIPLAPPSPPTLAMTASTLPGARVAAATLAASAVQAAAGAGVRPRPIDGNGGVGEGATDIYDQLEHDACADNWPKQCRRKASKCWSAWVLARCPRTCGLCEGTVPGMAVY